ncbi:DUF2865 domain-containing protein [Methylorubrum sp. SL192]|uniref:DUF2865 domain-containing protein n=1 Tax=Methylorubrum sp. SL192 TaxID=2995167 RepID=UPI0022741AF4|nr:DUF2865 domain-containing protein [Methylorubrum sp. SL192]MCY1644459.1 DUF2865 domain-containing protein [Methylorubrum sp. SL192]
MSVIACAASCGSASSRVLSRDPLLEIPSIRTMPMIGPQFRRVIGAALAALVLAGAWPAAAAPDVWACQRYRTELANLNASASTASALQSEVARLESYYRSLNCEGGKFLFFDTRPPQCGAVEARIRSLNATYGGGDGEVVAARRRQLVSAVSNACTGLIPGEGQEGVSGGQTARGGPKVICVKTCDGSYFPMGNLPDGRGGADEMCQALCPGTEAVAYSMPHGDDALKYAATLKGSRAYTALPTAFKFRKSFTADCSCKQEGQTWAQSLVKAESMLVRHKGDIFVTPMTAEKLSRAPKVRLTLVGRADRTAAGLAADAASRDGAVAPASKDAAEQAEQTGSTGERSSAIRVIVPSLLPPPALTPIP